MTSIAIDDTAFAGLTEWHRHERHVHCSRMLASFDDAEDAVQETLLRAWRGRESFDGSTLVRAWLYRIATNVCIDRLRRSARRPTVVRSFAEVPWLQPYPDRLLDQIASRGDEPDVVAVERETIELAFLAALQVLPPRRRAAFIARDVLGWSAGETATLLDTSLAATNSALPAGRAAMQQHLPERRTDWSARQAGVEEQALLAQFIDAHERCDTAAAVAISAQDIRVTMPPYPYLFAGLDAIAPLWPRRLAPTAWAGGDWWPPKPTGCPPRRVTCAAPGTHRFAPSRWTFSASRPDASPRSPPSAASSFPPSPSRPLSERAHRGGELPTRQLITLRFAAWGPF
jgi:RNA polymerase sigma-70 factor (TIGR02960 family)